MLTELVVRDLGPVRELSLLLGPGMTALTGETGAGKTILTEAIKLLCGARSDSTMVRTGANEAVVEGRFGTQDSEIVVRRVVPSSGRSRAYIDGSLASLGELASTVGVLIDLHGQNGHQSLAGSTAQRNALDEAGGIDTGPLLDLRAELRELDQQLDELGGDARARNREIDLFRFQLQELDAAGIEDPNEDELLQRRERQLANATEHRQVAAESSADLGNDGVAHTVAEVVARLEDREPFEAQLLRLRSVQVELSDLAGELGRLVDELEDDPAALDQVQTRRQRLAELRRKYGASLAEVIEYRDEAHKRLAELESHDERAAVLDAQRSEVAGELQRVEAKVGKQRREAAGPLAGALEQRVRTLAIPNARIEIRVGETNPGHEVAICVAMNSGSDPAPIAKVASGGELSRTMLALQLELSSGPPIMIFDEVDAGVGGEAAGSVAAALGDLARDHQVLVVTHLAQVAAVAEHQVRVLKVDDGTTTNVEVEGLNSDDRVIEIARMLSGDAHSGRAKDHARELLGLSS